MVPGLWEEGGGGFSAVFPPLCSAPSSQEGWYSLLHWGRNVPCVSNGLCPVLHWLFLIYTPPAVASCCPAPVALICPPPRAPSPAPQPPRLTELVFSPLSPWSGGQPSEFILEGEGKLQKGSGSPQFMFLLSLSPSPPLPSPPFPSSPASLCLRSTPSLSFDSHICFLYFSNNLNPAGQVRLTP